MEKYIISWRNSFGSVGFSKEYSTKLKAKAALEKLKKSKAFYSAGKSNPRISKA